ncbi:protein of unknown function DUF447 [Isosphaera pallida ATCC 43644]|uniref:DUF447 family protein n=1 Tax=Isosphaera pallida (strain ATCC 43644 / DSM 9630 / IS1B) TaxID=575540 RepID=E8QYB9_ISOPI|nr:DUF447 domain-containing protein [Isosphaera pallida]ADV63114.1 protein of unknown function DUF447 [Isosphaera pallida ATCC 43644]
MIVEGLVTTRNEDGSPRIRPMGPKLVDDDPPSFNRFVLRPYRTSATYRNLIRDGQGVLHVVDDVLLLARALLEDWPNGPPPTRPAARIEGFILEHACRYFEFRLENSDPRAIERAELEVRTVASGELRPFLGLNRAMGAVVEAAVLASRVHLLPHQTISEGFERLAIPVEKTGGPREREAFDLLRRFVDSATKLVHPTSRPCD